MRDWFNARLQQLRGKAPTVPPAAAQATPEPAAPRSPSPWSLYLAGFGELAGEEAQARLAQQPDEPDALLTQAALALDERRPQDALAVLRALLERTPDHADALAVLARTQAGNRKQARDTLARALAAQRDHPQALAELALLAMAEKRLDEAAGHLARAAGTGPRLAEAHYQLGEAQRLAKHTEQAALHYRKAIAAHPAVAQAHAQLGALLKEARSFTEAEHHLQEALRIQPELPLAAYNLAMLRIDQHRWPDAARLLRQYLVTFPKDADAHYWLANALMGQGETTAARQAYQAALKQQPAHVQARWGWLMAQLPAVAASADEQRAAPAAFARELDKTRAWLRTSGGAEPWRAVGAIQPFYLAYVPGNHREVLQSYGQLCTQLMDRWARKVGVPAPAPAHTGKLRVGIVSAHIHAHSVWHALLKGWLQHLDARRFDLQVFHTGTTQDEETRWAAGHARLHQGLGDWTAWAKAISDAKFDVLIYPEIGMDATTVRLSLLRLARVQVASWGHPLTTGLPTMDAYLSAAAFEPAGADQHYSEQLIPLPRLGCAYRPYGTAARPPDLADLGLAAGDRLLLCAGVAAKYGPAEDALWIDIARRCAPCKLVFFRAAIDHTAGLLERRLREAFAAAGVDFERHVVFIPWQSQAQFFGLLQRADAYLDSVHFSGFNTAMQAIECGAPAVAWEGDEMRGRFASGILRELGLGEWVAADHADYAALVQRLCEDRAARDRLKALIVQKRAGLYDDRASVDALGAHLLRLAGAS